MLALADVADVLGLPATDRTSRTAFGLIKRLERGLPISAFERVVQLLAPLDTQFRYRLIPKATYERRKAAGQLAADEGVRVARLARVWSLAADVWQSDDEARDFLFRPHAMLDDNPPVDVVIRSEFGAEMVIDILARLKYGTAA